MVSEKPKKKRSGKTDERDVETKGESLGAWARRSARRVPLASAGAFLMCVIGVVVFSACLYVALEYLITLLDITVVGRVIWVVMVLHLAAAAAFLLLATLSTGSTRREMCTACLRHKYCSVMGKLVHVAAVLGAYGLHFLWLLLPAVLILPVALLTAVTIVCPMVPDCISLSDYGIPPEYVNAIDPDMLISELKKVNSTDLERYINQAEGIVDKAITSLEGSPLLEQLLSTIEDNVPTEEEVDAILDSFLVHIDADPLIGVLGDVQDEVRKVDTDQVIDGVVVVVNRTLDHLDTVTDELEKAVDAFSDVREDAFDALAGDDDNSTSAAENRTRRGVPVAAGELGALRADLTVRAGARRRRAAETGAVRFSSGGRDEQLIDELIVLDQELQALQQLVLQDLYLKLLEVQNCQNTTDNQFALAARAISRRRRRRQAAGEAEAGSVESRADAAVDGALKDGEEQLAAATEEAERLAQEAERLAKEAEAQAEVLKQRAEELAKQAVEEGKELAKVALEEGARLYNLTEQQIEKIVNDAKIIAKEAELAAKVAAKEAELALEKAEQATKAALADLDTEARRLAREGEEYARKAAKDAQQWADQTLERAKEAAKQAEIAIKAAAEGATDVLIDAARNVRKYAKEAITGARWATKEAAKGARKVAKMFDVAKKELIKGYEMVMLVADQLGIEKTGNDTFCSQAKVEFCAQAAKAHVNMIFVFVAAIVVCKSMVHFLMAMAANWVHLRREEQEQQRQQEQEQEPSKQRLVTQLTMNERGSMEVL